jgi:hypothetical protein
VKGTRVPMPGRGLAPGSHAMLAVVMTSLTILLVFAGAAFATDWSLGDCTVCHTGYPNAHPLDDCYGCHGQYSSSEDPGNGHYYTSDRPAGSCTGGSTCHTSGLIIGEDAYLHGYWLGWDDPPGPWDYYPESPISYYADRSNGIWSTRVYSCDFCHSAAYPYIARHDQTALEATHLSDGAQTGCANCHSIALASESGHPECITCHLSSDPLVIASIADWDRSCTSCHPDFHKTRDASQPGKQSGR